MINLSNCLSAYEREACDGLLTMKECLAALKGMVRGSTPGVDGFPMEFYLAFWDILGRDLASLLTCAHELGHMSPSQCRGLITLLHKGVSVRIVPTGGQFPSSMWIIKLRPGPLLYVF